MPSGFPQKTWTDGEHVAAAALNTYVRDAMVSLDDRVTPRPFRAFLPQSAQIAESPHPIAGSRNGHALLFFGDEFDEKCNFSSVLSPDYDGGGLEVALYWASTATSGTVVWEVEIESHTADADDLDSDSFASATQVTDTPASDTGRLTKTVATLADGAAIDSLAAGESYRLRVTRNAADAADDLQGFAQLARVTVRGL